MNRRRLKNELEKLHAIYKKLWETFPPKFVAKHEEKEINEAFELWKKQYDTKVVSNAYLMGALYRINKLNIANGELQFILNEAIKRAKEWNETDEEAS